MNCVRTLLDNQVANKIMNGVFCPQIHKSLIQYVLIKENTVEFYVFDPIHSMKDLKKISETPIYSHINDSAILKVSQNGQEYDLLVLTLSNNTIIILQFDDIANDFIKLIDFDLSSKNAQKAELHLLGKRLKVFKDYIIVSAYQTYAAILSYRKDMKYLIFEHYIEDLDNIFDIEYYENTQDFFFLCNEMPSHNKYSSSITIIKSNHAQILNKKKYILNPKFLDTNHIYYKLKVLDSDNILCFSQYHIASYEIRSSKLKIIKKISNETILDIFTINDFYMIFYDNGNGIIINKNQLSTVASEMVESSISTEIPTLAALEGKIFDYEMIDNVINYDIKPIENKKIILLINSLSSIIICQLGFDKKANLDELKTLFKQALSTRIIDTVIINKSEIKSIEDLKLISISDNSINDNYLYNSVHEISYAYQLEPILINGIKFDDILIKSWIYPIKNENFTNSQNYYHFIFLNMKNSFQIFEMINFIKEGFQIKISNMNKFFNDQGIKLNEDTIQNVMHFTNYEFYILTRRNLIYLNVHEHRIEVIQTICTPILSCYIVFKSDLYLTIYDKNGLKYYKIEKNKLNQMNEICSIDKNPRHYTCIELFNHNEKIYLAICDYNGDFTIFDPTTGNIIITYKFIRAIHSILILNEAIYLGTRDGILIKLNRNISNDSLNFLHVVNEDKQIFSGPIQLLLGNSRIIGYCPTDGNLVVFDLKGKKCNSVVYKENMKNLNIHPIDDKGALIMFEKSNLNIFELSKNPGFFRKTINFTNSINHSIGHTKKNDKLKRIMYNQSSNILNIISTNMDLITADLKGNILNHYNLFSILEPKNENMNSYGRLTCIEPFIFQYEKDILELFVIGYDILSNTTRQKSSWMIYGISLDKLKQPLGNSIEPILNNPIDIFTNQISCMKYISEHQILLVGSGQTLYLYILNKLTYIDKRLKIEPIQQNTYQFRSILKGIEYLDGKIMITEKNFETKVYILNKIHRGENLGHQYNLTLSYSHDRCRILNHAIFVDKDSHAELDKFGMLYISSSTTMNCLKNINTSTQIDLKDSARQLIKFNKQDDQVDIILHPGLQGGLKVIKKLNLRFSIDQDVIETHDFLLKFEERLLCNFSNAINGKKISFPECKYLGDATSRKYINWNILDQYYNSTESVQKISSMGILNA